MLHIFHIRHVVPLYHSFSCCWGNCLTLPCFSISTLRTARFQQQRFKRGFHYQLPVTSSLVQVIINLFIYNYPVCSDHYLILQFVHRSTSRPWSTPLVISSGLEPMTKSQIVVPLSPHYARPGHTSRICFIHCMAESVQAFFNGDLRCYWIYKRYYHQGIPYNASNCPWWISMPRYLLWDF